MRISKITDYELIDASSGERLERWGNVILIRPDPQVIWKTEKKNPLWYNADARYIRSNQGGGHWETYKKIPDVWQIGYRNLKFNLKPMGFKHTGLFPEQAANWDYIADIIKSANKPLKILNLFAYTGGATISAAEAGAEVTHVDSSKGMVEWAKENATISNLRDRKIRWLVDDCVKFVQREIRRGNKYDGIIMDPPSYGRGPKGEIWRFEDEIYNLVLLCKELLSDDAKFILINSYTGGVAPSVCSYILNKVIVPDFNGKVTTDEIGLKVTDSNLPLPCGVSTIWER
jgi:23S rRNA (cytosine1962-C5)-methyltransferase